MKKAVITTGGKQYVVTEGDEITIELIKDAKKNVSFEPLLVIDDANVSVGSPNVKGATVEASIIDADTRLDKVTSIRYKAKKRVRTVKGHKQRATKIKITKIAK